MAQKRLVEVTDKNGVRTRRWKRLFSRNNETALSDKRVSPSISMRKDRDSLSEEQKLHEVEMPPERDLTGRIVSSKTATVTPGVIDEDSREVFRHGQCFAFAVEAAKRLDTNVVMHRNDDGKLVHAYAESRNGRRVLDIDGWHSRRKQDQAFHSSNQYFGERGRVEKIDPSDADALASVESSEHGGGHLMNQHYDLAQTLVDPVLALGK